MLDDHAVRHNSTYFQFRYYFRSHHDELYEDRTPVSLDGRNHLWPALLSQSDYFSAAGDARCEHGRCFCADFAACEHSGCFCAGFAACEHSGCFCAGFAACEHG